MRICGGNLSQNPVLSRPPRQATPSLRGIFVCLAALLACFTVSAADATAESLTIGDKVMWQVTVNSLEPVNNGKLRISEICPKPQMEVAVGYTTVDAPKQTDAVDPNGAVAGWIELVNEGTDPVNLAQYELQVFNRGKKASAGKFTNLPNRQLAPGERVLVYTTKDYCKGGRFSTAFMDEDAARAFTAGEAPGIVADEIVLSTKVNPKKFPMVRLLKGEEIVDTVIVPCDLPDNASVVAMDHEEGGATLRYMTTHLTPGAANSLTDAVKLGPNVGPLYGVKHSFSDLDPVPPATQGQNYAITLDVNPVDAANAADEIVSVTLVYRTDVNVTDEAQFMTVAMAKDDTAYDKDTKKSRGQAWTAAVPAANLPAKGQLLQWRAQITDAAGNMWTSPAFLDKQNGYGWYGTIVDPGVGDGAGQLSATLPTLHLFAETGANNKVTSGRTTTVYYLTDQPGKSSTRGDSCLMNRDYDETYECTTGKDDATKQNFRKFYPYGARVAIYDSQTSNYYDNVRIDCRGNSSDDYYKRSHGLKFSKIKPYKLAKTYVHPVSGEEIDEVAKTSFCAEYNDPAMFRQRLAFWFMNAAGVPAPWEDPKRINLNGQFYQLAYESPRFGDELLCDIYGFDELGYGYKNVGAFHQVTQFKDDWGFTMGTSGSAGTKRYTPDDGKEKGFDELLALFEELKAAGSLTTDDSAALTKTVAGKFDLPAWINYLAATKITQEGDDAWGNVGAYWDNAKLLDGGVRGTGAWRPLAWDMNCTWGQYYQAHVSVGRNGIMADQDWNKCHPLYGGVRILGYKSSNTATSNSFYGKDGANYAFEAVFQSTKFRRLFLRRLRTLMDKYLKAQNTPEADTPIAVMAKAYANEVQTEAVKDRALWGNLGTTSGNKDCDWVNCWGTLVSAGGHQPADPEAAYADIWQNYIVPRRVHLFQTHSVDDPNRKGVGYGVDKCAGIPHAQSAFLDLRDQITIRTDAATGSVVIENMNAETVDISGWKVSGPVEMTLPPGTVVDQKNGPTPGQVFVTTDRRATIAKMTLTDQVVVGNGKAGSASAPQLANADGEPVYPLSLSVRVTICEDGVGHGTVTGEGNDFEIGATVTLSATPDTGYRFTKWIWPDGTEVKDNPYVLEDLQESVALTANIKPVEYKIVYDPNGGVGEAITSDKCKYDKKCETLAADAFAFPGRKLAGWGIKADDGTLVEVCKPGEKVENLTTVHDAKVRLYAMWDFIYPVIDDGEIERTVDVELAVGETRTFKETFRKNLRYWLLGSPDGFAFAGAELNVPSEQTDAYAAYLSRSAIKTNEVTVTIRGVGTGESVIYLGRQYKLKDPRCAVCYRVNVK